MSRMAGQIALFVRLNPAAGVLVFVTLLCVLISGLKVFSKRYAQHPELLRKVVHIGIGLATLTFPWLFAETWPVASIALVSVALLSALKVPGPLRKLMGGVVDGVDRSSSGDLCFPIGVVTLFWLSQRCDPATSKLLFCVPVLLLTLGDAVAALVGVRYGRHKFSTAEGMKSVEGSLACFLASFLCTLLPLIAFSRIEHVEALLLAMILALVATMLEAIAWSGLDNLFLPLGGYALLKTHIGLSLKLLLAHFAATLALLLFALAWRRRTSLNDSAVLGAALYGYCAWSIGGMDWVYAPLILFVGYPLMWPRTWRDAARTHTIGVVLAVGAAGLA